VEDSGIGLTAENLEYIFDKFRQFNRVHGEGERGTGLGLYIVKGIIELHKGNIWAESEFGRGTKLCFILPKSSV
jgi:signal transduction histidine kinase